MSGGRMRESQDGRAWTKRIIESVKAETLPDFSNPTEAVVYNFARELLDEHRVSEVLYAEAVELLGEAGVVELVILLGYYTLVSMTLNVFEVPVPAGERRTIR